MKILIASLIAIGFLFSGLSLGNNDHDKNSSKSSISVKSDPKDKKKLSKTSAIDDSAVKARPTIVEDNGKNDPKYKNAKKNKSKIVSKTAIGDQTTGVEVDPDITVTNTTDITINTNP